ncbi:MAG: DUF2809 domain-containing protein [Synechococcales bacterium]|nr:DUF2809 domain-containing protein [Synechococcales bacterium]
MMNRRDRPTSPLLAHRLALAASLIFLIPLGYWVRFFAPVPGWVRDWAGSVCYEIFWIALVALILPRVAPIKVAIAIFLATCFIEVLQLWRSPFWQAVRATVPGRLVFGNTFRWGDFLHYLLGSWLGWLWIRWLAVRLQIQSRGDR